MAKFIAHVVMKPNEGGAAYTVETEFKANSYPQAWEHVSRLGLRFNASIVSHRIHMVPGYDGADDIPLLEGPPPPAPTLTVNAAVKAALSPKFYGEATIAIPPISPFPYEEKANDPVAA